MTGIPQHDVLLEQLGTAFGVDFGGGRFVLDLVEVSDRRRSNGSESFLLLFRGSNSAPLESADYVFHHDVLEPFHLFIVPVAADADGRVYEAVINRSHGDAG